MNGALVGVERMAALRRLTANGWVAGVVFAVGLAACAPRKLTGGTAGAEPWDAQTDSAEVDGANDAGEEASDGDASEGGQEAGRYCASIGCAECHGTRLTDNCAPPVDTHGRTERSERGVGAHQFHLGTGPAHSGTASRSVQCTDCHRVPSMAALGEGAHMNGAVEVVFGGPAAVQVPGAGKATFDPVTGRCTDVYCHHPRLQTGGINPAPVWTQAGSENCGACHSLPPALPHPQMPDCYKCHGKVINQVGAWVDASLHIDGALSVVQECDSCHGGEPGNFVKEAPPRDLSNPPDKVTTDPQVGAHQAHLAQEAKQMGQVSKVLHAPHSCADCHAVPATNDAPGHLDSTPGAEMIWSSLATADGLLQPDFDKTDPQAPRCKNVYCHGGSLCDGYLKTPRWNGGAAEAMCGTCHGVPPLESRGPDLVCGGEQGAPHAPGLVMADCATCHPATIRMTGASTWEFVNNGECHVNGKVSTATCDH